MNNKEEYRRKLPHIQPDNAVYFVTFNLKGALPKPIVAALSEQQKSVVQNTQISKSAKLKAAKNYFEEINDLLENSLNGSHVLKEPKVANVVAESIHYLDGTDFKLICFCIMSNHVHFIAYKLQKPLHKIMQSLKSYTARECNKVLNRQGGFWQREYFDRMILDRNDLHKKIQYVLNNPVKTGLVNNWQAYTYNYCRPEFVNDGPPTSCR